MLKVFTWYGATLEMDGATETDYTADEVLTLLVYISCELHLLYTSKSMREMTISVLAKFSSMVMNQFPFVCLQTPMIGYVNVHAILEARRSRARASSSDDSGSTQVLLFLFSNQNTRLS